MILYDHKTQTFLDTSQSEKLLYPSWYLVLVHAEPNEPRYFARPTVYRPGDPPEWTPHFRCFLTGLVLRAKARKVCCDHADPESAFAEYRASSQNPDSLELLDDLMTAIRRGNGGYVFSCLDRLDDAALGIAAATVQTSPHLLWWHGL